MLENPYRMSVATTKAVEKEDNLHAVDLFRQGYT